MPARQDRRQSKPDRTFRYEPHRRLHLRARSRILSLRKANDTCQPARRRLQSHLQADTHTSRPTRSRTQYEGRQRHQVGGRHRVQRLVPFHEVFHQHQVSRQRRRHHLLRRRTQAALLQVGTHLARQHP